MNMMVFFLTITRQSTIIAIFST